MKTMKELRLLAKNNEPAAIASEMCKLFPDLRNAPGVDPWEPGELDTWAATDPMGANSKSNVRFILGIWSGSGADYWKVGKFELADVTGFDQHGLKAFQEWAEDPFWL